MKRPVGILNVKVVRAIKLKKKDLLGASDPYVKLKISEEKLPSKKTTVKHKNLNPEWNEEFTFPVKDPEGQVLEISVYDWEQVGTSIILLHKFSVSCLIVYFRTIVNLILFNVLSKRKILNLNLYYCFHLLIIVYILRKFVIGSVKGINLTSSHLLKTFGAY